VGAIELGRLVRPVGIKGEVKLLLSSDFWPESLGSAKLELALPDRPDRVERRRPAKILKARPQGECLVLRLEGVDSRDAAEALREAVLVLDGELDVEPPAEPRSWQLEGMRVVVVGGEELGRVVALLPMPGQPMLQVKGPTKEYQIPFVEPILCGLDWAEETIEIDPPDGLLEL